MKRTDVEEVVPVSACFRQRVNLPAAQVSGLSDVELASALGFEIEPFSGIPRSEGEIAWKRVDDGQTSHAVFEVVQIRKSELAALISEFRKQKRTVHAVTAEPESASGETMDSLPRIPLGRRVNVGKPMWIIWGGVCALMAALLAADAWSLRREVAAKGREAQVRRRLQSEKDELNRRIARIRQEAGELRKQRADTAEAQQNVEVLRDAWGKLLREIHGACADEGVVTGVKPTGAFSAQLSGVALSAEAASRIVARLTTSLAAPKSVWSVRPGAISVVLGGNTVKFTCELRYDEQGQFK